MVGRNGRGSWISRRDVLLGSAAVGLCGALGGRRRSRAAPSASPLRLVLIPLLNGVAHEYFYPTAASSLVAEPLVPYLDRITFLRGLDIDGSWDHMAVRSMFTGARIDSYTAVDPSVRSLDQTVAAHLQSTGPTAQRSVHLGALPASSIEFYKLYGRSTFFFDPSPVDYDANPVTAFDRLFGVPADPVPPTRLSFERESAAILSAELETLRGRAAGSAQLAKLDQHEEALQALAHDGPAAPSAPACDAGPIASVEALRPVLEGNEPAAYQQQLYEPILDAQVDLLARALVCGLTRVGTLQANSADGNAVVPVLGGRPHHDTSHGSPVELAEVQRWYASKVARLLALLDVDDPLDPGRTVLDNSCVLWMAECNPGHDATDIVALYAGGLGGRLRTGVTVSAEGATNKNLHRAICQAFGVGASECAHFGTTALTEVLA